MLETISAAYKGLEKIVRGSFIVGDCVALGMYLNGDFERFLIERTIKSAQAIKEGAQSLEYLLNNGGASNPTFYGDISNVIIKNTLSIGPLAWIAFSILYSAYWLVSGVKGKIKK